MIRRFWCWLTNRPPSDETDRVIHALRNQTQVVELQRYHLQRARERADMTWLEAALTPPKREDTP